MADTLHGVAVWGKRLGLAEEAGSLVRRALPILKGMLGLEATLTLHELSSCSKQLSRVGRLRCYVNEL